MNYWIKTIDNNGIKSDGKKPPRLMPGVGRQATVYTLYSRQQGEPIMEVRDEFS